MKFARVFSLLTLLSVLLVASVGAVDLDGRTVILLITKNSDSQAEQMRQSLLDTRREMGFSKKDIPIVFMTFDGSETEREYTQRLGVKAKDAPILCVAEWGKPAHFGPKKVMDQAITREATRAAVDSVFVEYFKAVNQGEGDQSADEPADSYGPGLLEIESFRFEASGKPFYLADAAVRVKNADNHTIHNITVRFYSKLHSEDNWKLMETQVVEKLPKGYVASRDFVGNTRNLGLIDEDGNAVRCLFRIEVEQGGQVLSREGEFVPSEAPVDVR